MATQEYQQLLISQIREIMKFAGNEEVTIYIDPADQSCLSSLTAAVNHPLTVSEYSFSGGTRAVIPGRHILIDNSFAAKFDAAKKKLYLLTEVSFMNKTGVIYGINGPVIYLKGNTGFEMSEMVYVGKERLVGEVIALTQDTTTVQVFEETTGLKPGEIVEASGDAISVLLAPGILNNILMYRASLK